jgi:hypothetical protein
MAGLVDVCSRTRSFSSARPVRAADADRSRLSEEGGVGTCSVSATVRRARSSVGGRRDAAFLVRAAGFRAIDRFAAFLALSRGALRVAFFVALADFRDVAPRRALDLARRVDLPVAFPALFFARPRLAFFLAMADPFRAKVPRSNCLP